LCTTENLIANHKSQIDYKPANTQVVHDGDWWRLWLRPKPGLRGLQLQVI